MVRRRANRASSMLAAIRAALPATHVVLQGVLPRGGALTGRDMFTWPNRFTAAIAALNAQYEARRLWCSLSRATVGQREPRCTTRRG